MSIERIDTNSRISRAVVHNGTVYLAGQTSPEPAGDVTAQTAATLKKIDDLLARYGSNKARILLAQVHLADMATFDKMNAAWEAWVPIAAQPARTVVEARLPKPEFLVEITVVAAT